MYWIHKPSNRQMSQHIKVELRLRIGSTKISTCSQRQAALLLPNARNIIIENRKFWRQRLKDVYAQDKCTQHSTS